MKNQLKTFATMNDANNCSTRQILQENGHAKYSPFMIDEISIGTEFEN